MKRPCYSVASFVLLLALAIFAQAGTEVEVLRDKVNLRSHPNDNSEVVCQLSAGDRLISVKADAETEWIQVVPPSKASLWVFAELVRNDVVAASKVNVRSGPGINYHTVGKLQKGDKVSSRGSFKDWLKVAPPQGSTLWIHKDYIKPASKTVKKEAPPKPQTSRASAKKRTPVSSSKPRPGRLVVNFNSANEVANMPRPVVMSSSELREDTVVRNRPAVTQKQQITSGDKTVVYEGVLRPSGFVWRRPSKYRLVQYDEQGTPVTICYVKGDDDQIESLIGEEVVVTGIESWIQGVRYSVLDASNISDE